MTRKNYTISKMTIKQLEELAEFLDISASEVVRKAVEELWEKKLEGKVK